jgi:acetyl-CoA carboxylase biotin carboxyl carrier protein
VPSDPKPASPRPFDVQTIEHLISLMAQHDLSEISLSEGEQKIRLRKGGQAPSYFAPLPPGFAPGVGAPFAAPPASGSVPAEIPTTPTAPSKKLHEIKSPMVGTFYAKPAPDKPDYVSVGSKVTPSTVICKVEAMKIFNDLTADIAGTIAEICVKNGEAVDFGKVLFRVELA